MSQERDNVAINLLKVFASLMVITIHVSAINFPKLGKVEWDISNFYNSFSRVCVPIFFMISGYFLLSREEKTLDFYKKRMSKIIPPLVFWSVIFYFYNTIYLGAKEYNILELLYRPASTHLWYLYAIFGLYLISPFLGKIYINSDKKERVIFMLIWLLSSSILPLINSLFGMTINPGLFQITSIAGYVGFFFIGAYIKDNPIIGGASQRIKILSLYILLSSATLLLTRWYSIDLNKPFALFYNYTSPIVIFSAISFFYLFSGLNINKSIIKKAANSFSSFALGVYCIHTIFIGVIAKQFRIGGDVNPTQLYIPMTVFLVFTTSCLVSYFCSKTPLLRKVF